MCDDFTVRHDDVLDVVALLRDLAQRLCNGAFVGKEEPPAKAREYRSLAVGDVPEQVTTVVQQGTEPSTREVPAHALYTTHCMPHTYAPK